MIITGYKINTEKKTVSILKDCKNCIHKVVCKYYQKQKDNSEFFKDMFHTHNNNVLISFEEMVPCSYFVHPLQSKFDNQELVGLDAPFNVIDYIVNHTIEKYIKPKAYKIIYIDDNNEVHTHKTFFNNPVVKYDLENNTVHIVLNTKYYNNDILYKQYDETLELTTILNNFKYLKS